jgi:hypothetical protein
MCNDRQHHEAKEDIPLTKYWRRWSSKQSVQRMRRWHAE